MSEVGPQPSRATLGNWIRLNLGMTATLIGLVVMAITFIWGAGVYTSDQRGQTTANTLAVADNARRLDELRSETHTTTVDIDRRLNDITTRDADRRREAEASRTQARREIEASLASLREGMAVLNAQMLFLSARSPPVAVGPVKR